MVSSGCHADPAMSLRELRRRELRQLSDAATCNTRQMARPRAGLPRHVVAVCVDEVDDYLCWRSSSAPKKLAARLRISLACFSSRFPCSNAVNLVESSLLTPCRCPSATSA